MKCSSMVLSAMSSNTLTYVGSSRIAYGAVDAGHGSLSASDVLAKFFNHYILCGYTAGAGATVVVVDDESPYIIAKKREDGTRPIKSWIDDVWDEYISKKAEEGIRPGSYPGGTGGVLQWRGPRAVQRGQPGADAGNCEYV